VADDVDNAHIIEENFRNLAISRAKLAENSGKNITGLCKSCGDPIDPRRLKVLPTARECIECANA
jgi:phage/conjugal plasmid C-4 type zinc finger TraR family protein